MVREGAWRHLCWECENNYREYRRNIPKSPLGMLEGIDRVRETVRLRDNRTCQKCKKVWKEGMRRFDIHHLDEERESIKDYSWDKTHMDRLITYCHKCHLGLHSVRRKISTGLRKSLMAKSY